MKLKDYTTSQGRLKGTSMFNCKTESVSAQLVLLTFVYVPGTETKY